MFYPNIIIYSRLFRGVGSLKYKNVIDKYLFTKEETSEILKEVYKMDFGEHARYDEIRVNELMEELF